MKKLNFEWDENKNKINIQKHGISFEKPTLLFETSDLILEAKNVDDEKRYALIGKIENKCYVYLLTDMIK
ncbi:BrnT family toxin [Nautilia sp.]